MKIIHGFRLSAPEVSGYPDTVRIYNGNTGDMLLYESTRFRTNPNPNKPSTQQPWYKVYAQIAPTNEQGIPWKCVETIKHGRCIALNDEGPVATTGPDPNNEGKAFATAVLIHCGFSDTWPGSMACQTIFPADWAAFISWFTLGETGIYILTDETVSEEEQTIMESL